MSAKEISERESRERKDKFKELRDMKKEERDRTVEDKDSIGSLASGLEFPGFSEAGEQIRSEIISAGEATDQHFDGQEREATDQVFNPQKEHEEELSQRSDGAARDIEQIGSKHVTTEAAQSKLDTSRSAAEQGKEAVDKVKQEQSDDRDQGEKDRDEQKARLKDTKVTFNA
jgi:hypothetical protein